MARNDAKWFNKAQSGLMEQNRPIAHVDAARDHLSALSNSVGAMDHNAASYHAQAAATHATAAANHYAAHSKHWIQGAIKHPGAFTAQAKKAGKSVASFASSVLKHGSHASATTKRRASLANTLKSFHKGK